MRMEPALGPHLGRFRASVSALGVRVAVLLLGGTVLMIVKLFVERGAVTAVQALRYAGPQVLLALGVGWCAILAVSFAACLVWHTTVFVGGIRSSTTWGTFRALAWHEVTGVSRVNLYLFAYYRLHAERGPTLWIPTEVSRQEEFASQVIQNAGEDHPFARALSADAHRAQRRAA